MYYFNSQWFFCFLSLPKTFVLMDWFCSRKVTHKPFINNAWCLNIKILKFDAVYLIDKIWQSLKFLFLHIFSRMLYIKSISDLSYCSLIISSSYLRKLIQFFIRVCWKFQRLCGTYMFCYLIYNNWSLIKKFILKNELPYSKKVAFICFNKKPFKNDEKCVLFPVKMSLFVLKIFKFLSWLFWLCKKWLDDKTKVSKCVTSQTRISLDQHSEMLQILLLWYAQSSCPSVQVSKCWLLAFTSHESFLKNKGRSGTSLPVTFSAWFLKKNIFHYICY